MESITHTKIGTTTHTNTRTGASILDAAVVVLAQNPGASLATIAKHAGIGRATLHRYYPKREDLLRALVLLALQRFDEVILPLYKLEKSKFEILKDIIRAIVPMGAHWHFLSLEINIMQDDAIRGKYEKQLNRLNHLVDEIKIEKKFASDLSTAWITASIEALIYTAWLSIESGIIARHDAPDLIIRTVFVGLS